MHLNTNKIRLIMAEKQLSVKEIASRCNKTSQRISCILNSQSVTPKTVGMLATALGVNPVELIDQ